MQTIYLDGRYYANGAAVHAALKLLLGLPDYYGANADALFDCLSERREPVNLFVRSLGEGETADTLRKVMRVVEDLGGEVDTAEA